MIKKIAFIILICIFCIKNTTKGNNSDNGIEICLTENYVSPYDKHITPRSVNKNPEAYMYGHIINFNYFDPPLTIELVDISDNNVVFNTTVGFGVSSIEVPASVKGTFIIKFINDDVVYFGSVLL